MGSPTKRLSPEARVDLVTGALKIPCSEIAPDEWYHIISVALEHCRPLLKYLWGFQPIKNLLSNLDGITGVSKLPFYAPLGDHGPEFDEGIDPKTKCADFGTLLFQALPDRYISPQGPRIPMARAEKLLLTDNGEFVIWNITIEEHTSAQLGRHIIPVECRFSIIDRDEMVDLLGKELSGYGLLSMLSVTAEHTVEDRERRLKNIRELSEQLKAIQNRLNPAEQ